jgi:hypothetical protein
MGMSERKPGGRKLVFDPKRKAIIKVRINRFKRFIWWLLFEKLD